MFGGYVTISGFSGKRCRGEDGAWSSTGELVVDASPATLRQCRVYMGIFQNSGYPFYTPK